MKPLLLSLLCTASAFAEVRTETIAVPMRDGIKLATDTYRDDTERAPFPGAPAPTRTARSPRA